MLLLALPFPAIAVRPDVEHPVWLCPPKRNLKRKGIVPERDLQGNFKLNRDVTVTVTVPGPVRFSQIIPGEWG